MAEKNLLASIEGRELNSYALHISNMSRGRFIEETNFELYLKTLEGEISVNPVVKGKYFSGRGDFYKPWLEISYDKLVKFSSSKIVDLSKSGLDEKVFKYLSDLLPPGAHIMVVYLNHEETKKGLEQGIPAPATPIGYLLWKSGFMWFKDWYFAEGFWEGDVKLQGSKPLNEETRRKELLEMGRELHRFLEEGREEKIFLDARKRAEEVLKQIEKEFPEIRRI